MVPFVVLLIVSAVGRAVGVVFDPLDSWPTAVAVGLAAAFLVGSSAHFVEPRRSGLIATVPRAVPHPGLVVTLSGLFEIVCALGLLVEPVRGVAAVAAGLFLIAVFPANVRAARGRRHPAAPHTPLPLRAAVQLGFLGACVVALL